MPIVTRPVTVPQDATPVTSIASHDGWEFTVDGKPFFCAGTNIYGIAVVVDAWTKEEIVNTLNFHAARGVNCIRLYVEDK